MSLAANALISLARAKAFVNVMGASQDPALEGAINAASTAIESYCGRPLKARTFTAERVPGPWSQRLFPFGRITWPIDLTEAITITVDGQAQTVWRGEADGDPELFDVMARPDHFWRREGWYPTRGYADNVVLTYTGGYDPVPEDLQDACGYVVQRMWGLDQQQQLTGLATLTPPNAVGGSVTFQARAYVFPGPALDILNLYRMPRVG